MARKSSQREAAEPEIIAIGRVLRYRPHRVHRSYPTGIIIRRAGIRNISVDPQIRALLAREWAVELSTGYFELTPLGDVSIPYEGEEE